MKKTVIINESTFKRLVSEQIITEADLSKDDIAKIVRDTVKSDTDLNKDIEKKVKALVAKVVNKLFQIL
jgi:BMFP domain-containing protein YqiC